MIQNQDIKSPSTGRKWSTQQEAYFTEVRDGSGHVVFKARAGTGKTTTIVEGFNHVPSDIQSVLYVVFNKKNQLEAREKITDRRVEALTWHSVGFRFIGRVWSGVKPDDSVEWDRVTEICGKDAPDAVLSAVAKLMAFGKNSLEAADVEALVEIAEEREIETPEFVMAGYTVFRLAELAAGAMELSRHRDPANRISFNDMVWLPVANNWVFPKYQSIFVDEAQDSNRLQFEMLKKMIKPGGRITLVGDDRQAIYAFRGAVSDGMSMMRRELDAKELGLTVTFRCPSSVVALAKEFVPDYEAHSSAPVGEVSHMGESKLVPVLKVGDVVISRANAPLMGYCLSVLRSGVRARIEGRDIGRALLALVRKIKGRSNLGMPDFLRKLEAWRTKQVDRINAKARNPEAAESKASGINDQAETLSTLATDLASVSELETRIETLFSDSTQGQAPCVLFTTTHKAKGLEWNNVYILSDTFLRRRVLEEENIYYVAITRAKKSLTLVHGNN